MLPFKRSRGKVADSNWASIARRLQLERKRKSTDLISTSSRGESICSPFSSAAEDKRLLKKIDSLMLKINIFKIKKEKKEKTTSLLLHGNGWREIVLKVIPYFYFIFPSGWVSSIPFFFHSASKRNSERDRQRRRGKGLSKRHGSIRIAITIWGFRYRQSPWRLDERISPLRMGKWRDDDDGVKYPVLFRRNKSPINTVHNALGENGGCQ